MINKTASLKSISVTTGPIQKFECLDNWLQLDRHRGLEVYFFDIYPGAVKGPKTNKNANQIILSLDGHLLVHISPVKSDSYYLVLSQNAYVVLEATSTYSIHNASPNTVRGLSICDISRKRLRQS